MRGRYSAVFLCNRVKPRLTPRDYESGAAKAGAQEFGAPLHGCGPQASFVAFDLVPLNSEDLRLRLIEEWRSALLRLAIGVEGILFSENVDRRGRSRFAEACELGLEGVEAGGQLL
jgi:hypothetical protein